MDFPLKGSNVSEGIPNLAPIIGRTVSHCFLGNKSGLGKTWQVLQYAWDNCSPDKEFLESPQLVRVITVRRNKASLCLKEVPDLLSSSGMTLSFEGATRRNVRRVFDKPGLVTPDAFRRSGASCEPKRENDKIFIYIIISPLIAFPRKNS